MIDILSDVMMSLHLLLLSLSSSLSDVLLVYRIIEVYHDTQQTWNSYAFWKVFIFKRIPVSMFR